jgi:hypothetical protein
MRSIISAGTPRKPDAPGTFTDLVKCGEEHERQAAVEVKKETQGR